VIYKRGKSYWCKFQHQGKMIYKSTGQTSATKARQVEARLRSELAMGNFGILERKAVPTLSQFIRERIAPKANQPVENGEQRRQKRFRWLRTSLKPLSSAAIGRLPLDKITSEHIAEYADSHLDADLSVGTVNRELRVLRRTFRLAVEWGTLEKAPKISMAGEDPFRVRVVGDDEFARYLLCASPLLADVATVLNETGVRPDELHRLQWEDVAFETGRCYGALFIRYGKTAAARRKLPMTPGVRRILEARNVVAGQPVSGWIFPAEDSKSGHITHSSLRKAHAKALELSKAEPFVLYSLRHTFATRLALSPNMDAWTLCKIMGWSSLAVAMRYIHPSEERVLEAFGQEAPTSAPVLSGTGDKTSDITTAAAQTEMLELTLTPTAAVV